MCGRSSLTKTEKEIEKRFNATFHTEELHRYNPLPNYNVAPTHFHPVVTMNEQNIIHLYKWGLIPHWSKDRHIASKMINARAETLADKLSFRILLTSKRCIIPVDGFYEWKRVGKQRLPYRITCIDQDIMALAGLWDQWIDLATGTVEYTFAIITTVANEIMKPIHDRMPVILTSEAEHRWINDNLSDKDAMSLLLPYNSAAMDAYKVSDKVNSVQNNNPSLILPQEDEIPQKGGQLSLF